MTRRDRRAAGFTLFEVLIALVIFAVMSAMAYRALTAILSARDHLVEDNRKWREASLFFMRLEGDLNALLNRPIRNGYDEVKPALLGTPKPVGEYEGMIAITRTGAGGQGGGAAGLQRVEYRLREGNIETLLWPSPDQAPRVVPGIYPMLSQVSELQIRYLDENNQWQTRWPAQPGGMLPRAVQVDVTLSSGERLQRTFAMQAQ